MSFSFVSEEDVIMLLFTAQTNQRFLFVLYLKLLNTFQLRTNHIQFILFSVADAHFKCYMYNSLTRTKGHVI